MCGICGFTGNHGQIFAYHVLMSMMKTMIHRGPDGDGTYYGKDITFGFRRLSIIDIENGSQPFFNETGRIVSMCNGEIYNYQDLRNELIDRGHHFQSACDAEVLVHAYEEWDEAIVDHLRGMYSFVIWDEEKEKLIAVRDPFGIKPLYYTQIDGCLVFASEIKTILCYPGCQRILNEDALTLYLSFQYSPLPETFFKGVYRLMPGNMLIEHHHMVSIKKYFCPKLTPAILFNDDPVLEEDLSKAIFDSVLHHLRSDSEVGIFLSGGVDSMYLASLAGVEKAFTVGFDEKGYNEIKQASRIAQRYHMKHREYLISPKEFWEAVPEVQYMMDEPLADASAVALYFLSQLASQDVKVVLSGDGADELFGGYPIYHEPVSLQGYQKLPPKLRRHLSECAAYLPDGMKGKSFMTRGALSLEERFIGNAYVFHSPEICDLLRTDKVSITPQELLAADYGRSRGKDDITRMQEIDLNYWLWGDILLKTDKMGMAHSLECRVPYLDRKVYEVASKLTADQKVYKNQLKCLFRSLVSKKLPASDAKRKKAGFKVPIRVWIRQEPMKNCLEEAFRESPGSQYFCTEKIIRLLDQHESGKADNSRKIWTIYSFLQWYKRYFA